MSWEGHLSGAVSGLLFSLAIKVSKLPNKKFVWEEQSYNEDEDLFMQHFDAQGNFIENALEEE